MKKIVFLAIIVISFFFAARAGALETIELGKIVLSADRVCNALVSFSDTARQLVGPPIHENSVKEGLQIACNIGRASIDFNKEYILVVECAEKIDEGSQCVFYGRLIKKLV